MKDGGSSTCCTCLLDWVLLSNFFLIAIGLVDSILTIFPKTINLLI